jgi:hypothetical protein
VVTDRIRMAPATTAFPRTILFHVVGTGVATGVSNTNGDALGLTLTLHTPTGLCVSSAGKLFFTSKGDGNTGDFIRML